MKYLYYGIFLIMGTISAREVHWDWSAIDLNDLQFPSHFYWGCSDSALQTEGVQTVDNKKIENSWTDFETTQSIALDKRVGVACERWDRFAEDVQLIADAGMNMYRFSLDWSKIEPEEGVFDQAVLDHYEQQIDHILSLGITPMVTLFHHVMPLWFAKKGGFEHPEYNHFFVEFAEQVVQRFHAKVRYWIILNEPIAYAIEAYWRGNYPPAKLSFRLAGLVAKNMLDLQVQATKAIKAIDGTMQCGIAHVMNLLDPYHRWHPFEQMGAKIFDYIVNKLTIEFFNTGKFNWALLVRGYNAEAKGILDFIGINYYTHTVLKQTGLMSMNPVVRPEETRLTDSIDDGRGAKVLYAEGLYRCIARAAVLHIPIFITENGSSTDDPALTKEYLQKHFYAISKALRDKYDVRGYLIWTLMDCFGWRKGYEPKHGMYAVDFATQERTKRSVFDYYFDVIKKFKG